MYMYIDCKNIGDGMKNQKEEGVKYEKGDNKKSQRVDIRRNL